ncbi:mCG19238 [Mus musculus]|nr:mCG19238 [Mus musculus]
MLRSGWMRLLPMLCSLLLGRAEAPSPGVPPEQSRPYAVLRRQSLVLMGTIFSILLVTVLLMAFCVYKPIRRR